MRADQIVVSVGPYRLVERAAATPRSRARKLARQRLAADQHGEAARGPAARSPPSLSSDCHSVGVACIDGGAASRRCSSPARCASCTVSRGAMHDAGAAAAAAGRARAPRCRSRRWSTASSRSSGVERQAARASSRGSCARPACVDRPRPLACRSSPRCRSHRPGGAGRASSGGRGARAAARSPASRRRAARLRRRRRQPAAARAAPAASPAPAQPASASMKASRSRG